jgi:hypothetical protein
MGDSTDAAVGVLLSLAEETRDDVKEILGRMAAAEQRLTSLEAARSIVAASPPPAPAGPTLARDAGLATGAGALVAAVMQIIAALGK